MCLDSNLNKQQFTKQLSNMTDFMTMKGQSLSLSGLRMGPMDPKTKVPKVGTNMQYQIEDPTQQKVPKFLSKERSGFSGGFKIPEEQRKAKLDRKIKHKCDHDSEENEEINKNEITKDEIMQHLNLGSSQAAGSSKHGTGSKTALTKDLIENLEKELEKLKRTEENIKVRKHIATKGDRSILDETEEDRQRAKNKAIEEEMKSAGNNVIHADQKRIQIMRHRVGQLDSVKSIPYEELETMRTETAARLKELEEQYWGMREGTITSNKVKNDDYTTPVASKGILKNKSDKKEADPESLAKPKFDYRNLKKNKSGGGSPSKSRSRSKSIKGKGKIEKSLSPPAAVDPRQQIYEAKFEKYLANKKAKQEQDRKRSERKPEDFDIYTKGIDSPSKMTKRFRNTGDPTIAKLSGKYNNEDLIPSEKDQAILLKDEIKKRRESGGDPFHNLGVSGADKMTFFLLKWVFNAIKRDSAEDDPKFQGKPYISKMDLIKQLSKNPELMQALGYESVNQLTENVKISACKKEGYLMWSEYLDFFFLKDAKPHERIEGSDWWNKLDPKGQQIALEMEEELIAEEAEKENQDTSNNQLNQSNVSNPNAGYKVAADRRPVKMNASMHMLQNSRAQRAERDVEEEFKLMAQKKSMPAPKSTKKVPEYDSLDTDLGDGFGFTREKSKNLLLNSQIEVMRQVFERLDKYNEGILRRSDFVMALRTDAEVIDFIDCEAVKKAYSITTLTLDAVLLEIEKDEHYDIKNMEKKADTINHKEFLTWREFLNYFNDYQEIEQRNKKQSHMQQTQKSSQSVKEKDDGDADTGNEMKTLMEQEKERRLQELPKLRPADQIDISEVQLQLLKDIFDSIPRAPGGKDMINTLTFFLTIRKDPQIRKINSAVARDPEGCSRIPRETFQEVFDRMERELNTKQTDWSTIVEFFTKRGRPLSKDEIAKLVDEDRRQREADEMKQRADEEAERRRNERIMGDIEEDEDFDDFEMRQKAEAINDQGEDIREASQDIEGDEEQEEEQDEDEDDIERAEGDQDDEFDGNKTTGESDLGESLAKTKLTQKDYAKRSQSAKVKKGKYGVTVPQPFGFDMRDKTKAKSIRERKIDEMIAKKRIEENNLVKYQFRSKPIPPAVLIPRYQSIIEADLARKEQVRSQSLKNTKEREAPFSFWERDKAKQAQKIDPAELIPEEMRRPSFKANPIPRACSVLIFSKKMKEDELKRGERVRKNAEIAYAKAKMPPTMQKYADRKKQEPPKKHYEEYSFKPDIGPQVTGKQLREKAERFQRDLAKKKGQKTQTKPQSPNFVKRSSKILDRDYVNEGDQPKPLDKTTAAMKALAAAAKIESQSAVVPPSTKATNAAQAKRRQEIQEKKQKQEAEKKAEADRIASQQKLAGTVQSALKSKFGRTASEIIDEQVKEKKKQALKEEKQRRDEIQERIKKARQRPMLFDQTAKDHAEQKNLSQIKAIQNMVALLKEANVKENEYKKFIPEDKLNAYNEKMEEQKFRDNFKNKGTI